MLQELIKYFENPTINKSGFCKECGISQQYLNRVLKSDQPITESLKEKLIIKLNADSENAQNLINCLKG